MSFAEKYTVVYETPPWCTGGLNPLSTDFPNEPEDSVSGYASGFKRLYQRSACKLLNGVWNANGECTSCLQNGHTYNASLICAGLNDSSNDATEMPFELLFDKCPTRPQDSYKILFWIIMIIVIILFGLKYTN